MLRARTLPAIITPALNILNAQLNQQNLMMMSNQQQQQQPIDYQSINDYQLINGSHHHHPHLGKILSSSSYGGSGGGSSNGLLGPIIKNSTTTTTANNYLSVGQSLNDYQSNNNHYYQTSQSQQNNYSCWAWTSGTLFSAVENEHFDRTRMIIETTNVDVNCTNSDGFTPLDIATMLLNLSLIKYLQSCGAREGDLCIGVGQLSILQPLPLSSSTTTTTTTSITGNLSSALIKEKERQIMFWQRRLKLLQRLKKGFDLLQPPPPPLSVHVQVAGAECLLVNYYPPIRLQQDYRRQIITKYKIEWSSNQFETIIGCVEMTNMCAKHEFLIERLESEQCYQVRIASGNCKGYSEYCYPLMNQSVPSTWRSIDKKHSKIEDRVPKIDQLFDQIIEWRQQQQQQTTQQRDCADKRKSIELEQTSLTTLNNNNNNMGGISANSGQIGSGNILMATNTTATAMINNNSTITGSGNLTTTTGLVTSGSQKKVRKSIRNFFVSTSKFQKTMKRGAIYLASLIYNGTDKRVLVTNEEVLPIIEIDDSYPSTLQNDFYWLLKITCCTWNDIKMFRKELEKSQQSSTVAQFRTKILLAIEQMQNSLGIIDLGKIYYKPLRDNEGSCVLCAIRSVPEPKMISCLSVRWLPLAKLQKRIATQQTSSTTIQSERVSDSGISVTDIGSPPPPPLPRLVSDILFATIDEMMQYHQACNCKLEKGLYIAYVKLKSSIDMMSVMVNSNQPNILPIAKIRNNPHVSRQEWAALKMCLKPKSNHHHHHQQQQNDLNDNHDGQNEDNGDDDDKQTWRRLVTSVSQLHLQLVNNTHQQQSETNSRNQKSKTHHSSSCSPNFLSTTSSINNHKTSLSSSDLMNQITATTTTTITPLSSPMTQTGPGFVDNFFQLACQHEQQQQQQIVKLSSSDQQQTLEKDDGGCITTTTTTTNIERIEKPKTLSVMNQQQQQSSRNINQIQKPQRLTFGQKMCFQQLTKFLQILSHTAAHFLQSIGIDEDKHLNINRIYTVEIIELDGQVSLILLLPPSDEVCSITQSDLDINQRFDDLLFLPLKIFELIHMNTYQRRFTGQYWRLSALLELDIIAAQQAQREAFSKSEVTESKIRLNQLLEFQTQLDEHCRSMRWIMDVVSYARDRQINAGITLAQIQHCLNSIDKQIEIPILVLVNNNNNDNKENESPKIIIAEPVTNDFDDGNVDDRNEGEQSPNEQIWISDSKKPADNEDDDDRYCFNDNFEDILVDFKCLDDDEDINSKKHLENETKQLSFRQQQE
ncbi:Ankyrin-repeat and fibronectin type III domain-containing 1 [Dermatophagoides pteronyssinus]|uniref:Ankyrin-repeat and fibronectin type III domain-containing 1 n=1 Tax=Dermatophagoides pteronyssinus TaxID=6956 RepID=A0ABQ8IST2_DERPT|nr:Ankyrin-repeat and fibronectin type III domain-containing 1 [Dermatophagoides pteronyssinus]